jgi:hypothetical protein
MPLTFVDVLSANSERRVVRFMASTGEEQVVCAVSFEALDDEDRASGVKQAERTEQFARHRRRVMEAASRLFFAGKVDFSTDPVVLVDRAALQAVPRNL